MSKKRKVPAAVQAKAAPAKPNPFELKGSKRNFSVLGKRDKTDKTNVIKSREAAQLKRKKTLLVEYKQLRKANAFIDRRFGEGDPGMDEEERALARLTAQRIRDAKKTSKFALGGDDAAEEEGGGLTHGGIPLDQLEDLAALPGDELGDMDEGVLRDIMQEYNFGGGGEPGGAAEGEGRKTRKQVMEEIIANSKMYKARKAREREEEEAQLAALDTAFTALVKGPGLGALVKPAGYNKGRKIAPDNDQDAAYDRAARELVFEAKAHAGERTLSPDELAAKEAERLAVLEKERLKRMRGDTTDTPGDEAAGDTAAAGDTEAPQGGYAAKRRRMAEAAAAEERRQQRRNRAGGDAEEEDQFEEEGSGSESEGSEGEDGLSALDRRRQERAAGDHPLQQQLREMAARLAEKMGVEVPKNPYLGDSGDEDEDSQGDEGEDEEEDSGSGEESAGEGEEEEEELLVSGAESEQSGSESEQEEEEEEEEAGASQQHKAAAGAKCATAAAAAVAEAPSAQQQLKQQQQKQKDKRQQQQLEGPLDLPYTIPVPADYQQFAALVDGRPPEQLLLAIQRIRAFNAAALASDNKRQLQLLYGLLVQHYAVLAGTVPLPMGHLDVLFGQLLTMVKEVPYYGATVARARLGKLVQRLTAAAADPMLASFHGWPAARQLLQVRLFSCQFPVSDKRHPVVTPLVLYLEKALVQCPVTDPLEAALGCLAAGMLLGMAMPAQRYAPEVYVFLAQLLQGFVPKSSSSGGAAAAGGAGAAAAAAVSAAAGTAVSDQQVPSLVTPGVLAFSGTTAAAAAAGVDQSKQVKAGSKKSKKKGQQQQQQMANGHHPADDSSAASIAPLSLSGVLSLQPGDTSAASDAFKLQLLGTVVATASRAAAAAVAACGPALPQVLQPLLTACRSLASVAGLPAPAAAAVAGLQQQMEGLVATCVAGRVPLVQTQRLAAPTPKEYNPRYEPEFAPNRSNDPDRARAGAKQLRRSVAKEQRGAMRELRKDAAFMAQARDAERAQVDSERLASERKFYAELQGQEADMRSGGQKGMHPHRKKKK